MSARKPAPMAPSPTEKQEAVRRIAEGEKEAVAEIAAKGVNGPATGMPLDEAIQSLTEPQEPPKAPEKGEDYLWQFVEEEEPRIPMTIRVPMRMKTALKRIEKFSNMTMTDVLVEGAQPIIERELAKIKARGAR